MDGQNLAYPLVPLAAVNHHRAYDHAQFELEVEERVGDGLPLPPVQRTGGQDQQRTADRESLRKTRLKAKESSLRGGLPPTPPLLSFA